MGERMNTHLTYGLAVACTGSDPSPSRFVDGCQNIAMVDVRPSRCELFERRHCN